MEKNKQLSEDLKDMLKGAIWTSHWTTEDKSKWTKEEWMVYHMDYLEGVTKTLSQHRAFFALVLVALVFIEVLK